MGADPGTGSRRTPTLLSYPGATQQIIQARLGAIGDSAIVDPLGLGAMTTLGSGAQGPAAFASIWPETAHAPRKLLSARHAGFARKQARLVVRTASVLDKAGLQGRLGGGFYRAPAELFARACAGLSI